MIEVKGDLWKLPPDEYPALKLITTSGERRKDGAAIMGRGCARQVRDMIPGIACKLGELLRKYGNRVFRLAALSDGSHLGSFPVKHCGRSAPPRSLLSVRRTSSWSL